MSRSMIFGILAVSLVLGGGCRKDPDLEPMHPTTGQLPPLPPASGTAIGYLLDSASTLALREDQLVQLKKLDVSLAAQNDVIDTQLRSIERPEEEPEDPKAPPRRRNHAPGVETHTTADAQKLHAARTANDRDAIGRVFAILDPKQQAAARKILVDRGVEVPGATKPVPGGSEDAVPLEP